jgi:hypothetical protein
MQPTDRDLVNHSLDGAARVVPALRGRPRIAKG